MIVQRFGKNKSGRDFAVGDIHGYYTLLERALVKVDFDENVDRLFATGDLSDRGPESRLCKWYLEKSWFFSVAGNHEENLIYHATKPVFADNIKAYGSQWWADLTFEERKPYVDMFTRLPVVIEVETEKGVVGIVHANIPLNVSWQQFTDEIKKRNESVIENAMWSRRRIETPIYVHHQNKHTDQKIVIDYTIPDIYRVFIGHSHVTNTRRLGNTFFIDNGAGWQGKLPIVVEITDKTLDLIEESTGDESSAFPI